MNDKMITEILAAHVDQLCQGAANSHTYLAMFPNCKDKLAPLLGVAEAVGRVLVPLEPALAFREDLRKGLLAAARQRQATLATRPILRQAQDGLWGLRREMIIGAAALGSASLVGGIAYFLRARAPGKIRRSSTR